MSEWQYRLERLSSPFTEGDANRAELFNKLENVMQGRDAPSANRSFMRRLGQSTDPETAEDYLNQFAKDGWKLVTVFVDPQGSPIAVLERRSSES
ncbi:DUF4177 domain-containing protein [Bradyrhizobium arachidis]|uniref:DUF4177 domain-containing protein n=1 Tax=Bradyrhizobium arachidis TaxID=858423 RepID=UPI002161FE7A|nr:DUF4177 domain-containing protein [Bradyrhizobium arachidis]UVO33785.1 DUF4177 domain-containing protein [Bradyrhizobium arachidis]